MNEDLWLLVGVGSFLIGGHVAVIMLENKWCPAVKTYQAMKRLCPKSIKDAFADDESHKKE